MSEKLTQEVFEKLRNDLDENGSGLEYDLRNITTRDGEQERFGDNYGEMTPEEIYEDIIPKSGETFDVELYQTIAQHIYNYCQHETEEDELQEALKKVCWNIPLYDSDYELWEEIVLNDSWEEFKETLEDDEDEEDEDDEEESDD